jgi:hypothetical protein
MSDSADWIKIGAQAAFSLISGAAGLLVGIWHAGKKSGKAEAKTEAGLSEALKKYVDDELRNMREQMDAAMDSRGLLVGQFQESFNGLRRQMDQSMLHTEQHFLRKDDFNAFREEYREDMREVKHMIRNGNKS